MMDKQRIETSKLLKFEDAAAGHDGVLTDETGSIVVKPCTVAEVAFYEETLARHTEFAALLPTFMGTLQLGKTAQFQHVLEGAELSISQPTIILPVENSEPAAPLKDALKGKPIETDLAIVLGNVAAGFVKPNILDVKLGRRLWDDDAIESKRQRLDKLAKQTTSASLGFRIAGMKTFSAGSYKVFDKFYGRSLTPATATEAFGELFDQRGDRPETFSFSQVLPGAIEALEEIERVISQQESRMYSSSLLFVYEGHREARRAAIEALEKAQGVRSYDFGSTDVGLKQSTSHPNHPAEGFKLAVEDDYYDEDDDEDDDEFTRPKLFDVRIIDFAHARWAPGEGPDENMLCGIRAVIGILKDMMPP